MGNYIGIDLGTTNSAVAVSENGKVRILKNAEGKNTTPSCIFFDGETAVVGEKAKQRSITDAKNYRAFIKRDIGKMTKLYGEYTPEGLSAIILKKLKQDAEAALGGSIDGAVITVPAYFMDAERNATLQAAEIAGIPVLGIIKEPTAAALAFLSDSEKRVGENSNVLVYDLGGGTFDISLLTTDSDGFRVIGVNGNKYQGGYDFDRNIIDLVMEQLEDMDIEENDLTNDELQQLQLKAEAAKCELSENRSAVIDININGKDISVEISRTEFYDEIKNSIKDTVYMISKLLKELNYPIESIDKLLLIGGSTRIPLVSNMIENTLGIKPSNDVDPDVAVAVGAAIYAEKLKPKDKNEPQQDFAAPAAIPEKAEDDLADDFLEDFDESELCGGEINWFKDCTSHSIGVMAYEDDEYTNGIVLKKNTPVPCEASQIFAAPPYTTQLCIDITEGEAVGKDSAKFIRMIGNFIIDFPPKPEKTYVKVTISEDSNNDLHVYLTDGQSNTRIKELSIKRKAELDNESIDRQKGYLQRLNIRD